MNAEMQIAESLGTNIKKLSNVQPKNDDLYKTIRKQLGPYSEILRCCAQI